MQDRVCEMTELDLSDFLAVRESQHEAESPRGGSFPESGGAEERSFGGGTELQSCNQNSRGKSHLTPCD